MKRDAVLQVRVTQEEKEWAEALAEEFGLKTSDYARMCIFVGPTPERTEDVPFIEDAELPAEQTEESLDALLVPEDASRDDYLRYLYERITELHRDKQKRWPGVMARRKAGEEWKLVREGKPLEKIEPREMEDALIVTPTTYRTA